jgi:hypothetical protein
MAVNPHINIGSPPSLKGLFDEQHDSAATAQICQTELAGTSNCNRNALTRSNDDSVNEYYAPVLPQSCKLSRSRRGFRIYSTWPRQ